VGTAKQRIWLQLLTVSWVYPIYNTHTQHHTQHTHYTQHTDSSTPLQKVKSMINENKIENEKYYNNINENTKDMVGLTRGTLELLFASNSIQIISSTNQFQNTEMNPKPSIEISVNENDNLSVDNLTFKNEIPEKNAFNTETLAKSEKTEKMERKEEVEVKEKTEVKDTKEKTNATKDRKVFSYNESQNGVDRMLQQHSSGTWTESEDGFLALYLESIARYAGVSPLDVTPYLLSSSRVRVTDLYVQAQQKNNEIRKNVCTNELLNGINSIFKKHSEEDVQIRVTLLLHFNDLLSPLLILVTSLDGSEIPLGGPNHPTQLLKNLRHLIFLPIIAETTHKLCSTTARTSVSTSVSTSMLETRESLEVSRMNRIKIQSSSLSPLCSPPLSNFYPPLTGATINSHSPPNESSYLSTSPTLTFPPTLQSPNPSTVPHFLVPSLAPPLDPMPGSIVGSTVGLTVGSGMNMGAGAGSSSDPFLNSTTKTLDPLMIDSRNDNEKPKKLLFSNTHIDITSTMNDDRNSVMKNNGILHILEIEENKLYLNSFNKISVGNKTVRNSNSENHDIQRHEETDFDNNEGWNLKSIVRKTLIGQMMGSFNVVSESSKDGQVTNNFRKNENCTDSKDGFNNIHSLESSLRSICSKNILWAADFHVLMENQNFPFYIRTKRSNKNENVNNYKYENENENNENNVTQISRLFQLLALHHNSDSNKYGLLDDNKPKSTNNGVSQRNIFRIFVVEALEEVFTVFVVTVFIFFIVVVMFIMITIEIITIIIIVAVIILIMITITVIKFMMIFIIIMKINIFIFT
jgi:hypothetical protein